jgi:hypothetical protein
MKNKKSLCEEVDSKACCTAVVRRCQDSREADLKLYQQVILGAVARASDFRVQRIQCHYAVGSQR